MNDATKKCLLANITSNRVQDCIIFLIFSYSNKQGSLVKQLIQFMKQNSAAVMLPLQKVYSLVTRTFLMKYHGVNRANVYMYLQIRNEFSGRANYRSKICSAFSGRVNYRLKNHTD